MPACCQASRINEACLGVWCSAFGVNDPLDTGWGCRILKYGNVFALDLSYGGNAPRLLTMEPAVCSSCQRPVAAFEKVDAKGYFTPLKPTTPGDLGELGNLFAVDFDRALSAWTEATHELEALRQPISYDDVARKMTYPNHQAGRVLPSNGGSKALPAHGPDEQYEWVDEAFADKPAVWLHALLSLPSGNLRASAPGRPRQQSPEYDLLAAAQCLVTGSRTVSEEQRAGGPLRKLMAVLPAFRKEANSGKAYAAIRRAYCRSWIHRLNRIVEWIRKGGLP